MSTANQDPPSTTVVESTEAKAEDPDLIMVVTNETMEEEHREERGVAKTKPPEEAEKEGDERCASFMRYFILRCVFTNGIFILWI